MRSLAELESIFIPREFLCVLKVEEYVPREFLKACKDRWEYLLFSFAGLGGLMCWIRDGETWLWRHLYLFLHLFVGLLVEWTNELFGVQSSVPMFIVVCKDIYENYFWEWTLLLRKWQCKLVKNWVDIWGCLFKPCAVSGIVIIFKLVQLDSFLQKFLKIFI